MNKKNIIFFKNTQNPHLKFIEKDNLNDYIIQIIQTHMKNKNLEKVNLLDIGGGKGWGKILYEKSFINYYALDLKTSRKEDDITFIKGDITENNLDLNMKFDIIFTKDTFEHILNPWDATSNILNHLINDGLFIFLAPFSWRYHPSPYDVFRFTHTGVQYLFERFGGLKKIDSGYIKCGNIGGFWKNKKDKTIDDDKFKNCLEVIYVGKRDIDYKFNINTLDSDFSWDHT